LAGAGSEQLWQRACSALGVTGLTDEPRFADGAARVAHRDELTSCIEAVLTTQPTEHWLAQLAAAGVPAAEVRGLASVLGWPQVAALGSLQTPAPGASPGAPGAASSATADAESGPAAEAGPAAGAFRVVGPPFRLDRTVLAYPGPAPALGRDTRSVLAELGYPEAEVARLEGAGVVVAG
jgi:crotonobetainyl-CoA:carnitine CoA-transferase CaiB-like acyl-CoA transferase